MKLVIGEYTVNVTAAWTACGRKEGRANKADTQAFLCMLSAMAMEARDAMKAQGYDGIATSYGRAADDVYDVLEAGGYFRRRGL